MSIYIYKGPCDKHTFGDCSWMGGLVTIAMAATDPSPNSQGTLHNTHGIFIFIFKIKKPPGGLNEGCWNEGHQSKGGFHHHGCILGVKI